MAFVLLLLVAWIALNAGVLAAALVVDRVRVARREGAPAGRSPGGTVVSLAGR